MRCASFVSCRCRRRHGRTEEGVIELPFHRRELDFLLHDLAGRQRHDGLAVYLVLSRSPQKDRLQHVLYGDEQAQQAQAGQQPTQGQVGWWSARTCNRTNPVESLRRMGLMIMRFHLRGWQRKSAEHKRNARYFLCSRSRTAYHQGSLKFSTRRKWSRLYTSSRLFWMGVPVFTTLTAY